MTPYEGDESYIFISYAHKDSKEVYPILDILADEGYRIWYDEGITPGSEWPENIAEHLIKSEVVIAFISANSIASPNCRNEVNFALAKNKQFLGIMLEHTEMSPGMELQLSSRQCIMKYNYTTDDAFYKKIYMTPDLLICKKDLVKQVEVKADESKVVVETIAEPDACESKVDEFISRMELDSLLLEEPIVETPYSSVADSLSKVFNEYLDIIVLQEQKIKDCIKDNKSSGFKFFRNNENKRRKKADTISSSLDNMKVLISGCRYGSIEELIDVLTAMRNELQNLKNSSIWTYDTNEKVDICLTVLKNTVNSVSRIESFDERTENIARNVIKGSDKGVGLEEAYDLMIGEI